MSIAKALPEMGEKARGGRASAPSPARHLNLVAARHTCPSMGTGSAAGGLWPMACASPTSS
eukprot:4908383-Pyramimonas_sp.AAC.1